MNITNQSLGQNPIAVGTGLWFAYAIAKSETADKNGLDTRYSAFWEVRRYGGQNQTPGRPVWNDDGDDAPGGYGLFQVTGAPLNALADIPRREIWNWRDNAVSGLRIVALKKYGPDERSFAVRWMLRQMNSNNSNGNLPPDLAVGSVTFSNAANSTRTLTDAVAIKIFNGGVGHNPNNNAGMVPGYRLDTSRGDHYCYWENGVGNAPNWQIAPQWTLSRFNTPRNRRIRSFDYVARVCEEVD